MFARVLRLMTKSRRRSLVALGIVALGLLPLMAANSTSPADEPWPTLLSDNAAAVEPEFAMLQLRANVTLARLVQAGRAAD